MIFLPTEGKQDIPGSISDPSVPTWYAKGTFIKYITDTLAVNSSIPTLCKVTVICIDGGAASDNCRTGVTVLPGCRCERITDPKEVGWRVVPFNAITATICKVLRIASCKYSLKAASRTSIGGFSVVSVLSAPMYVCPSLLCLPSLPRISLGVRPHSSPVLELMGLSITSPPHPG